MSTSKTSTHMGFFEHLDELRVRLFRVLFVFVGLFLLSYFLVNEMVMSFLRAPLFDILPQDQHKLYFTSLFENFLTHLKVSGVCAFFLLLPYLFFEIWKFVAPGLYQNEKKIVIPVVVSSTFCFLMGSSFAYFIVFPSAFKFFVEFGNSFDTPILTIDSYYTTCLKLLLLFGLAFEFPVFLGILGYFGIIDSEFLRIHRKNAILVVTFACAMFAPPDVLSMILLMIPLVLMYELMIHVIKIFEKKRSLADERSIEAT